MFRLSDIIYILDTCCLVLHATKAKGYLITNFRGSTMKKNFVPTCQTLAHKIDKKGKNLHIKCERLTFQTLFYFSILRVTLDVGANSTIDRAL